MTRDRLIELLAKSAFDHERPDPVSTAPQWSEADEHDRDVYIGAARSQLAALDKAGLAVSYAEVTEDMIAAGLEVWRNLASEKAVEQLSDNDLVRAILSMGNAAGRIDKGPEGV